MITLDKSYKFHLVSLYGANHTNCFPDLQIFFILQKLFGLFLSVVKPMLFPTDPKTTVTSSLQLQLITFRAVHTHYTQWKGKKVFWIGKGRQPHKEHDVWYCSSPYQQDCTAPLNLMEESNKPCSLLNTKQIPLEAYGGVGQLQYLPQCNFFIFPSPLFYLLHWQQKKITVTWPIGKRTWIFYILIVLIF